MICRSEIEIATGLKTQHPACFFCGSRYCAGGCAEQVTAEIAEERLALRHAENQAERVRLAKRRNEVLTERRDNLLKMVVIQKRIAEKSAELEQNRQRLSQQLEREVAAALATDENHKASSARDSAEEFEDLATFIPPSWALAQPGVLAGQRRHA